jgi:NTE family protein
MLDQDSALHDRVGSRTGLVLSGGGARGAYEIGVIAGFIEILDKRAGEHPPFEVFAGTSIGALNSALLASRADRGDLDIDALVNFWHQFQLEEYLKIEPRSWFGALSRGENPPEASIFDPTPLKNFTQNLIPWERLQQNMKEGALRALIFTSWELATGRSVWFTQMAAGHDFPNWPDHRREVVLTRLDHRHAMASAAIPWVVPPQFIDGRYYCDGGVRFSTPLASAIRAGADRLVVIKLRGNQPQLPPKPDPYPWPWTMLWQIFGGLAVDASDYELSRIKRINTLLDGFDANLTVEQREAIDTILTETRGKPWQKLPVLHFSPQVDFGQMALDRAAEIKTDDRALRVMMRWMKRWDMGDLLSFVLFDHVFIRELIEQGREDAHGREEEILAFFKAQAAERSTQHAAPPSEVPRSSS